jgi:hypothetical protein
MGIVGTYDQGLDYISKLSQQQQQQQQHVQRYAASPAGPEDEEVSASGADSPTSTAICPLRQLSNASTGADSCSSGSNSNSNSTTTDAAIEISMGSFLAKSEVGVTSAAAGEADCAQEPQLPMGDAPRVILWLGSSIGNCSREAAAVFLRQVQEKAMRPGGHRLSIQDAVNRDATVHATNVVQYCSTFRSVD